MNRLADLFEQFTLPEITRIFRRTAITGLVLTCAALLLFGLLGAVLVGVGALVGMVLGFINIRLVMATVARVGASGREKVRRPIAGNTMLRLALTTAAIFLLAFTVRPLGMGALGGIAVFYFIFLGNVMRALFASNVSSTGGTGGTGGTGATGGGAGGAGGASSTPTSGAHA